MSQLRAFKCPSCTASLDYDGRSETIRCEYCATTIIVPDSLMESSPKPGIVGDEDPQQAAHIREILYLVQQGKKIEAIKLYRETFDVSLKEAKEAVEHLERGQPTAVITSTTTTTTTTAAASTAIASTGCSCLLPFIILLIVACVGLVVFYAQSPTQFDTILQGLAEGDVAGVVDDVGESVGSSLSNKVVYNDPILLKERGDGIPPDLLLETWTYGGDEISVSIANTTFADGRRQTVWQVDVGVSGEHPYNVGFDDKQVYLSMGSALQAHTRDSGEVVWETVLSDEVNQNCRVCIRTLKDRVIVLTVDNTLEAFDTNTGRSAWQVRLENEYFSYPEAGQLAFALVDGMVGILDDVEIDGSRETAVFFYDADTGEEVRRLVPLCPDLNNFFDDDAIDHNTQIFLDETAGEMVVLFGTPAYVQQMCLQKWDVGSGELLLDVRLPPTLDFGPHTPGGLMGDTSGFPFAEYTPDTLLTTLEIETENGRSPGVVQFDLTTGETLFQYADEDYNLAAIGQSGDVLLVRAERQRGTSQFEIWGLDGATGQRLWKHILQAEYVYELDPFDDRFSARLQADGLIILQLLTDSDPAELLAQKLNPADGSLVYETKSPLDKDDWRGLTWTADHAYLTLSNLLAVDLETGETAVEWP